MGGGTEKGDILLKGQGDILLKGQCHKIFYHFFGWAPYKHAKMVSLVFLFSQRYSQKTCVRLVVDTVSALSITTLTWCQCSQRLR